MKTLRRLLKKLIHNPFIDLSVGLILLIAGLLEVWDDIGTDIVAGNLRSHHAIALLGLITALRAVTDIFAGLAFMDEAEYEEKVSAETKAQKP